MSRVYLTAFADVALPLYDSRLQGGTAPTRTATVTLADGTVYDAYGSQQAPPELPYILSYDATPILDTEGDLQTALAALSALRGKRAKLYRLLLLDGSIHWAWARLLRKGETSGVGGYIVHLPQSFQFQVQSTWRGHRHLSWLLDDGYYLDDGLMLDDDGYFETMASSPHVITVSNGGNGIVRSVRITITAGSASITALTLASGDMDIDWVGTLSAGQALVLNTASKSILNNGVNAYSGFSYGAAHRLDGWIELAVGDNNITVTFSGGSTDSTVTVEFQDVWE